MTYAIKEWHRTFEDYRTREVEVLTWVAFPTRQDSETYRTLMASRDGMLAYSVFVSLVQIAARSSTDRRLRGVLRDDRGDWTPARVAIRIGSKPSIVAAAMKLLHQHGWLIECDSEEALLRATAHRPTTDRAPTDHRPRTDRPPTAHRSDTDAAPTDHRPTTDGAPTAHRQRTDSTYLPNLPTYLTQQNRTEQAQGILGVGGGSDAPKPESSGAGQAGRKAGRQAGRAQEAAGRAQEASETIRQALVALGIADPALSLLVASEGIDVSTVQTQHARLIEELGEGYRPGLLVHRLCRLVGCEIPKGKRAMAGNVGDVAVLAKLEQVRRQKNTESVAEVERARGGGT